MPMDSQTGYVWPAAGLLPAAGGPAWDSAAVALAAALGNGGGPEHSTNAESADSDECAVGQHPQRYPRQDGASDPPVDREVRTSSLEAGGPAGCPLAGQRGGESQKR